jgi:hypothetical protein
LVGKPEGKRTLTRLRCKWKDDIITYLREIWLEGVDWIQLAQDRNQWRAVVKTIMKLQVP